jgi:hypothetical protein
MEEKGRPYGKATLHLQVGEKTYRLHNRLIYQDTKGELYIELQEGAVIRRIYFPQKEKEYLLAETGAIKRLH